MISMGSLAKMFWEGLLGGTNARRTSYSSDDRRKY